MQQLQERCTVAITPIGFYRMPVLPIDCQHCPALLLWIESDTVLAISNASLDRQLTVRLTALARGDDAFTAIDNLITKAHAAIMRDSNLRGLALGVHELDTEWDSDDADDGVLAVPARYAIGYRRLVSDLTRLG